ncbi:MAG TPA: hypothetical protein VGQ73_02350 [Gemmatimonadales bacterium]|jgi:hypothetical protein|nr:hypothetical protein [Gemmatimonadales bacterium]
MSGYALYAPQIGKVINSDCRTRQEAETRLFDRQANGEAFDGEYVFRETPVWRGTYRPSAEEVERSECQADRIALFRNEY